MPENGKMTQGVVDAEKPIKKTNKKVLGGTNDQIVVEISKHAPSSAAERNDAPMV